MISADKQGGPRRYGVLALGNGDECMVARVGFGPRGQAISDAFDAMQATAGGTLKAQSDAACVLFRRALEPFYNDATIDALIDSEAFAFEDVAGLVSAILSGNGAADPSKKNGSTESLTT